MTTPMERIREVEEAAVQEGDQVEEQEAVLAEQVQAVQDHQERVVAQQVRQEERHQVQVQAHPVQEVRQEQVEELVEQEAELASVKLRAS